MRLYELVEGWTAPLDFDLLSKNTTPAGTMTSFTAALILKDDAGNLVVTTGDVTIPNANLWQVRYTPDSTDLVEGNYRARFQVTDGVGRIAYFPSGEWDKWIVRRVTY